MATLTDWDKLSREVKRDRRKGKRVPLTFPVEVSGFDQTARIFTERTRTTDISEIGCRVRLKTELAPGAIVAIRLLSRQPAGTSANKPLLFQIVWVLPDPEGEGWVAGALKLQSENIWHVAFPPTNGPKPSAA